MNLTVKMNKNGSDGVSLRREASSMTVSQAKQTARAWVEANAERWPGLRAAHLVGGITALPDEAPFPATKDVDLHLIFDEGSPALRGDGSGPNILEVPYGGVPIEAGIKSAAEYASPEVVLANPEIAYHLTVDSVLVDPTGWLRDLQEPVRREYRRRRWVLARLEHEQKGFDFALGLMSMVRETWGAAAEWNLLGYSTSFLAAALAVATLSPPRMGGRTFVHQRELLASYGRLDLHEAILDLLGVRYATPERVDQLLWEGAEAFDLAVTVRRSPRPFLPFEHKLHAHLRPYLVDACQDMIAKGCHREALPWIGAFTTASTDLLLVDGPEDKRPMFAARLSGLLREVGFDTDAARAAKIEHVNQLRDRVFALAAELVSANPGVID